MRYHVRIVFSEAVAGVGFGVVVAYGVDTVGPSKWVILGFPVRRGAFASDVYHSWIDNLNSGNFPIERGAQHLRDLAIDAAFRRLTR